MTNQSNEPGRHRPERTGTTPIPAPVPGHGAHGGGTPLAGQIMASAWRAAAAASRADREFSRDRRELGG